MGSNALQKDGRYTYADYVQWPADQRWEIVDGVAYMLTSPNTKHQQICVQLVVEFGAYLRGRNCQVFTSPYDVVLPDKSESEISSSNVVQPDLLIVCDRNKLDDKKCIGSPDLVVEIISPSTAKRDMRYKYQLYEHHGVREYWIVHPDYPLIEQFASEEGAFKKIGSFSSEDEMTPHIFPDLTIKLSNIFDPTD